MLITSNIIDMKGFATHREAVDAACAFDRERGDGIDRYYVTPNERGGFKVTVQRPGDPNWRLHWIAADELATKP